jgi:hypothetical protein
MIARPDRSVAQCRGRKTILPNSARPDAANRGVRRFCATSQRCRRRIVGKYGQGLARSGAAQWGAERRLNDLILSNFLARFRPIAGN